MQSAGNVRNRRAKTQCVTVSATLKIWHGGVTGTLREGKSMLCRVCGGKLCLALVVV